MADGDKKGPDRNRITDQQRYKFIGFEVFPGKPKELFKNDAERQKLVDGVRAKRQSDETLRDDCTLLEERVSTGERIVLAIASVTILAALLLPWYSAYTEVPAEGMSTAQATEEAMDTLAVVFSGGDSLATPDSTVAMFGGEEVEEITDVPLGTDVDSLSMAGVAAETPQQEEQLGITTHQGERANEQIITAHAARARTQKEYVHLSGFGTFAALGSVGGPVFSSGIILMLTGVLMLVLGLLCVALPVLNFYSIFGLKGNPDEAALKLKKFTRLNWLPLIIFTVVLILSFVGADYGFDSTQSYTSLGDGYSVGVLLGSLSWGVFVAMAASILVAVKGIEI